MPIAYPIKRSLVIIAQPQHLATDELFLIRDNIKAQAPDIHVLIAGKNDRADLIDAKFWIQPAITVSFGPLGKFKPPRGPVLWNRAISKIDQFQRISDAGIRTPKTSLFHFGMKLPVDEWGEFCILKPASLEMTSNGRGLFVFRTNRLETLSASELPEWHFAAKNQMLVQSFIETGSRFRVYRTLTLFGEVIYQNMSEAQSEHPALTSSDSEIERILPEPPRSLTTPTINVDPDVMRFASSLHNAFPSIPLLGCDILKEQGTGNLYALEVNAGGNVWHLSSPRTQGSRTITKTLEYVKTFQPFDRAALALIRMTRRHAS